MELIMKREGKKGKGGGEKKRKDHRKDKGGGRKEKGRNK